jgi:TolB-like protein/tetratricopeptide (TPR) repeat protein
MKLWQDLRRRRVLRFAGLYIVGAWVVIQVADVFFPAWGIPDAALRYLFYAALGCFPIALVFSWFYDVTARGILRTLPAEDTDTFELKLRSKDYLVLAALVVVAVFIVYDSVDRVRQTAVEEQAAVATAAQKDKPANSIAVLPFDNLDPNSDTGYFSDGVSEEILHRLSSIRALKVIARQSSFALRGSTLGIDRVSDLLGVRYLLGGSVRRAGDRVRLTAQLLDDSGYQVWSESFDGDLSDIFSFQADIAEQVASRITRELVVLKSATKTDPEAYSQYLIGRQYFHDRPPNWADAAAAAYRRALEIDPEFAPAYAGLAIAYEFGGATDLSESYAEQEIVEFVDRALELDPELAEAWLARGAQEREPELKKEYLERALALDPGLGTAYNWLYVVLMQMGQKEEAFAARRRGLEVDPLNPPLLLNNADVYLARSDFDGWVRAVSPLLELPEPPGMVYHILARTHLEWGRLVGALHWQKERVRAFGSHVGAWELLYFPLIYEHLGEPAVADEWLALIARQYPEARLDDWLGLYLATTRGTLDPDRVSRAWLEVFLGADLAGNDLLHIGAFSLISAGRFLEGIELLEPALLPLMETDSFQLWKEWENQSFHWLAYAYQEAGRTGDAARILDWSRDRVSRSEANPDQPFAGNPGPAAVRALDHAVREDYALAAASLREAVDAGWRAYHTQVNLPPWRDAWQRPEFAAIAADLMADIERQRQAVEEQDARRDFRQEFETLMAANVPGD